MNRLLVQIVVGGILFVDLQIAVHFVLMSPTIISVENKGDLYEIFSGPTYVRYVVPVAAGLIESGAILFLMRFIFRMRNILCLIMVVVLGNVLVYFLLPDQWRIYPFGFWLEVMSSFAAAVAWVAVFYRSQGMRMKSDSVKVQR